MADELPEDLPDRFFYQRYETPAPYFSPWAGYGEFREVYKAGRKYTLVSPDRCWMLYALLRQALAVPGNVWECGVYRGGTAAMLACILAADPRAAGRRLRLFDTFAGMPRTDPTKDRHVAGDFWDTSLGMAQRVVGHPEIADFRQGFIPATFAGLEGEAIAFAHVDVDVYQSMLDCCAFIWPRLSVGGVIAFDDYGAPSCPGARRAVDEYFAATQAVPLVLPTGQAVVFKSVA